MGPQDLFYTEGVEELLEERVKIAEWRLGIEMWCEGQFGEGHVGSTVPFCLLNDFLNHLNSLQNYGSNLSADQNGPPRIQIKSSDWSWIPFMASNPDPLAPYYISPIIGFTIWFLPAKRFACRTQTNAYYC